MRLNLNPGVEAYRLFDHHGIIIHARPALSDVIEQAKADASLIEFADEVRLDLDDGEVLTPEMLQSRGRFGLLFAKAVARQVIESWEGIEDPDGSPAPVTADRIDALLDVAPVYDAFTAVYMGRWLTLQVEKNGSAPSPTGTSEGAPNTARGARAAAKSARKN